MNSSIIDPLLPADNPPKPTDKNMLGFITVRRSMRLATKKRINYCDLVLDDDGKKIKSKKRTVRDILKMEISPIRHLKNLTIEARHTLSLQESKKKRLQFENSLFLPNNKKRKDVLKTYFNKKSSTLENTKEIQNTSCCFNSNELNKHAAPNQSSFDSDLSWENSEQFDKSPMKRNFFINNEKCNEEFVAYEEIETVPLTEKTMSFPSYVSFRTKLNKLRLVKNKIEQESTAPTNSMKFEEESKKSPSTTAEEPESTTKSDRSEIPTVSNNNSAELKPQICTNIIEKAVSSPGTLIVDGTPKSQSIERTTEFTGSLSVTSPFEVIMVDSSKFKKLVTQPASMSAISISPYLPSSSSNSMEFLMQSTPSNDTTASSSDCLETINVETPNIIQNNYEMKENTINDSLKTHPPTEAKINYLIRATSPELLGVIVRNEKLPITSKLIQDAEVQSTSTPKTLQPNKMPKPDAVKISTSITKDIKPLPNIECSLRRNCTDINSSKHQEASNEKTVNQPSSHNQVLYSLLQSNSQRNVEIVSQQRKIVVDENIVSTLPSDVDAEQAIQAIHIEEHAAQSDKNVQNSQTSHFAGQEYPSTIERIEDVRNIEFSPQLCSSRSSTNQEDASEQAEIQSRANSETVNPLTKLQNAPNCNRYFKPFYLQRPVFNAETTRSTSTPNTPNAEQQHAYMHVTNEQHLTKPLNPLSSTHEITNIGANFYQTKIPLEAHGKSLHYSYSQTCNSQIDATQQILSHPPAQASKPNTKTSPVTPIDPSLPHSYPQANNNEIGGTQQIVRQSPAHASEQNNHTQKPIKPNTKTSPAIPIAPSLPYSCSQAYNSQISPTQEILSQSPAHAFKKNNNTRKSIKPKTKTSQATPTAPSMRYCYPQAFNSQIGATKQTLSHSLANASEQNKHAQKSTPLNPPSFQNHPYYSPSYSSSSDSSCSTKQHSFPPFPAIQQQNNTHSNYVANTSNFQNSPFSQSHIANPNICGYPPTCLGDPNQPFNGQPYFPSLQGHQYSSGNQTGVRTGQNQPFYDSRNIQSHSNCQNLCWGQHKPVAEQPFLEQRTVDPNKWLNDRFQHIMKPHYHDPMNDFNWLARPQESIAPVSTNPVDMNAWMRARTQQATKPPELTTEQRITQLEVVVNSFNEFVHNFQSFKNSLVGSGSVNAPPMPVQLKTPPPWQTMTNNSPIIGNITTQPVPDARIAWAEYNNNLMNTRQMTGNIAYPGNSSFSSSSSQNSMRMEGNPVNQYPVPQNISHQINAADSTTGGNYNSRLDLRSFRPTQRYNQSNPHNTSQSYKNSYPFYKTH